MKASIKLYKNDGAGEYGFPVKLIISHSGKTRRKTIGYAQEDDWDLTSQLPLPSHDDFENLYGTILLIKKKAVTAEFRSLEKHDKAFGFLMGEKQKPVSDFYKYADQLIERLRKNGNTGNARVYEIAATQLENFRPQLNLKDITPQLMVQFKESKKAEGLKNSSIKHYLQTLRAIYNNAVKNGMVEDTNAFQNLFKDIPVKTRRARNYYLDEERIAIMENWEFPDKPNYELARDMVLLQFYLCGTDFMDIAYLKRDQIQNGRVFLSRAKLGKKADEFDILLPEKAKTIIERWENKDDKIYFFDFPRKEVQYRNFRTALYRGLNRMKKYKSLTLLPKDGNFTFKVMRHSFATLGKFKRIEEDLLRELMGHERSDVDTIYKDKYPESERDAAQLEIINLTNR